MEQASGAAAPGRKRKRRQLPEKGSKGAETRLRILAAAREVFTKEPFRTASVRQIAAMAGVRHPLVLHYFGSKAALFMEVAAELEKEVLEGQPGFCQCLQSLPGDHRGRFFLNGVLFQGFRKPDSYRFMLLNAGDTDALQKPLLGLDRMLRVWERILIIAREHLLDEAPDSRSSMIMLAFTLIISHYVGARAFHQKVLGLEPKAYEDWVKDAVQIVFEPLMSNAAEYRKKGSPVKPPAADPFRKPAGPPQRPGPKNAATRGERARQRILKAAKKVFSAHSYHAATIRMVGSAGNFDFSLIHHLFPTKEALFEAVAREAYSDFLQALTGWQTGLSGLSTDEIYRHLLGRGLHYGFENQDTIGLLLRNVANYEAYENLSGFVHMTRVHSKMLDLVRKSIPPDVQANMENLNKWLYTIVAAGYTFAGAPEYPASLLNLSPNSKAYRHAVFEILYRVFAPSLLRLTR